jgi:hypothetical protein
MFLVISGNTTMVRTGNISLKAVLRTQDVYPGSRILTFSHPGSRIPDPVKTPKKEWEKMCCILFVAVNFSKFYIS